MDSSNQYPLDMSAHCRSFLRASICAITGTILDIIIVYTVLIANEQLVYPLYKNEVYGAEFGASSFAVDVAMRYTFSSIFPLFTIQMVNRIGFDWTITLCAFVLLALAPVPFILQKYGAALRERSQYVQKMDRRNPQIMSA
jgi:hypothetical protein